MTDKKNMKRELKLKVNKGESDAEEVAEAINTIKEHDVKNGRMPKTASVKIEDFAGKVLKRTKSVIKGNNQVTVEKGTKWEDIDAFGRKQISFQKEDFE